MTHTFRAAMSLPLLAFAATPLAAQDAPDQAAVVETYANIAEAAYGDALSTARDLDAAIDAFLADPTEAGLEAARAAWRSARTSCSCQSSAPGSRERKGAGGRIARAA